jgi:DNA-dependent RNA polymerase auxiliary subunit epsilon
MISKCVDLGIVLTKTEIEHIQSLRLDYQTETKVMQNMEDEKFSRLIELIHQHDFEYRQSDVHWKWEQGDREEKEIKILMRDYLWEDIEPCIRDEWRKEFLMSF